MNHFAIDIDGCLTNGKGNFTSAFLLHSVQKYIQGNNSSAFLCTGRSAPYVEAFCQLLSISQWCVCENGAYIYQPMTDEVRYNPLITNDTLSALDDFKEQLNTNAYKDIYKLELGKSICISLNPIKSSIEELYDVLFDVVDHSQLYINHSTTAVDITPKGVDKGSALEFLCNMEGFKLTDIVAIGDSSGDLPFMKLSGNKACPNNASREIKEICDYHSPLSTTEAVLDIFQYFDQIDA